MAVRHSDILHVADLSLQIAEQFDEKHGGPVSVAESFRRKSVHAAYYAAYHVALLFAVDDGFKLVKDGKGGSHQQLWEYFRNRHLRICVMGHSLKSKRVAADYKISQDFTVDPEQTLAASQELIDHVFRIWQGDPNEDLFESADQP